jgi:16S rRNA (uracil1498-N3)-methyltransferase
VSSPGAGWPAAENADAHVFVERLDDRCEITGSDGHHLQRARRIATGEAVTAADGAGAWRRYEVVASAGGRLPLAARTAVRAEPAVVPAIDLALALTKGGIDAVVARVTELGVARITPLLTRRTVVRWDATKTAQAVERWRGIAREAAAQSRRARLPVIAEPASVETLVGRDDVVVAERAGAHPSDLAIPTGGTWTVAVGPEGGFAPEELDALSSAPRLRLGPYTLRAETAPVAAVAVLMARIGEPGS